MTTAINKASASEQQSAPPLIVGIGASAGGLERFSSFFPVCPEIPDSPLLLFNIFPPITKALWLKFWANIPT